MAIPAGATIEKLAPIHSPSNDLMEQGDRLSGDEFERRYAQMPEVKKAELIGSFYGEAE